MTTPAYRSVPDKEYMRALALEKYGMSPADFQRRLSLQQGKCLICEEDITGLTDKGRLKAHIDHDHESGVVRGLLCQGCNCGLGFFKDSPKRLRAAAQYITNFKLNNR